MNFINDIEKMEDFKKLSKNEFLKSYSYITEDEYDETDKIFKGQEYIPIKEIAGNEDLHEIAKYTKFENEYALLPRNTTRIQFIDEIIKDIKWQLTIERPEISKEKLEKAHNKILKIKNKEEKKKER